MANYGRIIPKDKAILAFKSIIDLHFSDTKPEDFAILAPHEHLLHQAIVIDLPVSGCTCQKLETFNSDWKPSVPCSYEVIIANGKCSHLDLHSKVKKIGFYPIHLAAGLGNAELFRYILRFGGDIYSKTLHENLCAFDIAIINRQYIIAEIILDNGFKYPQNGSEDMERVFAVCIYFNEVLGANLCIRAKAKVSADLWKRLFYQAVDRSHYDAIKWLLDLNIGNVSDRIRSGYTALHCVKLEHIAELLLEHGADSTIMVNPCGTPLMVQLRHKRLAVAECILKSNPQLVDQVEPQKPTGESEEVTKFYSALHYSAWQGYLEGVKLLCRYGANHNLVTYDGNTVVGLACHSDWLRCVEYLLPLGCDPNQQDKDGDTALIYATHNGNWEMVDALLKNGADASLCNNWNVSPLWNAVYSRSLESVKLLLAMNADPRKKCRGQNIYQQEHIYDVPVSPLFVAIHHEDLSIAKALIEAGCYINGEKFSTSDFHIYVDHWAQDNKRWLEHVTSNPPSLSWWCKKTIRSNLLPLNPKEFIRELPIPFTLKDYIEEV